MIEFDMKITGCTLNPMSTDYRVGYESGTKSQQTKIDELQARIDEVLDYVGDDFTDYYTGVMIESIHEILKGNKDEN